jgi:hypothetical protein
MPPNPTNQSSQNRSKGSRGSSSRKRYKKPFRKNYKLMGIIALSLMAFSAIAYRPLDRQYDRIRFNKAIATAKNSVSESKYTEADRQVIRAWNLSRKTIGELRQMFEVANKIKSPQLNPMAEAVAKCPDATPEDLASALEVFSISRSTKAYIALYQNLPDPVKQNNLIRYTHMRFLAVNDRLPEAIPLAEELAKIDYPRAKLALIDLWLREAKNETYQDNAARLIRQLLASTDRKEALEAYRRAAFLAQPLRYFRYHEMEKWADQSGEKLVQERLFFHGLRARELPEEPREQLIRKVIADHQNTDPEAIPGWLSFINESEKIDWLPEELRKTNPVIFCAYIESLLDRHIKQQKQIEKGEIPAESATDFLTTANAWLAAAPPKVDKVFLETCLCSAAFLKGDTPKSFYHQERAFRAADFERTYKDYYTILNLSERFGDFNTARVAAVYLSKVPTAAIPETSKIAYYDKYLLSEPELLTELYQKLHASRPDDTLAALKYATLLVTHKKNSEAARQVLAELTASANMRDSFNACTALTYLGDGDAAKGLAFLQKQNINWHRSDNDYEKAIYSTLLLKTEDIPLAEYTFKRTDWKNIPPFLEAYLMKIWGNQAPSSQPPPTHIPQFIDPQIETTPEIDTPSNTQ